MSPEELEALRLETEPPHQQCGWIITHRMLVYCLAVDSASSVLTACPTFKRLSEQTKLRLLRLVTTEASATAAVVSWTNHSRDSLVRSLRRFGLLDEVTRQLTPLGRLVIEGGDSWKRRLLESLSRDEENNPHVAAIAQRQLRREAASSCGLNGEDGNLVAFPLDASVQPGSLRSAMHELQSNFCHDFSAQPSALSSPVRDENHHVWILNSQCHVLPASEIYRPYLNDWTPIDVSSENEVNGNSELTTTLSLDGRTNPPIFVEANSPRILAAFNSAAPGGLLSWRQKQHRQQSLAIRLATRSALIGLKHSISVEPAKNYLELYVNMISRAVEAAEHHVRRWSYQVESSWRRFKELAESNP